MVEKVIASITDIKENLDSFKRMGDNLKSIVDFGKSVNIYITHPIEIVKGVWIFAVNNSFGICLSITLAGTILYIIGIKKGAKWAKISFFSYIAIQVFNSVSKR